MTRPSIGGTHGHELLAALSGRDRHRPTDPQLIAKECRRLAATGLRPRDIAAALRLDLTFVISAVNTRPSANQELK
jgi:hypothetical protein